MTSKKFILIANWKMNPESLGLSISLIKDINKNLPKKRELDIVFAVPSIFLVPLKTKFKNLNFAIQDISSHENGAHTGEISAYQAYNSGARFSIIGHSEKRASGDTNDIVSEKIKLAFLASLSPIVCVGENIRDDSHNYLKEVEAQVKSAFKNIPRSKLSKVIVAYEPVWAIGSEAKRSATSEEALEMSIFIRRILSDMYGKRDAEIVRIIYGASVDEKNGRDFIKYGGMTGLLAGRLSLSAKKFVNLAKSF